MLKCDIWLCEDPEATALVVSGPEVIGGPFLVSRVRCPTGILALLDYCDIGLKTTLKSPDAPEKSRFQMA